jgi:hypothetical protein
VEITALSPNIQQLIAETPDVVQFIKDYTQQLELRYGKLPDVFLFAKLRRNVVGGADTHEIGIDGRLFIRCWRFNRETIKPILKFTIAHEYMHWRILNNMTLSQEELNVLNILGEENLCNYFGLQEINQSSINDFHENAIRVFRLATGKRVK